MDQQQETKSKQQPEAKVNMDIFAVRYIITSLFRKIESTLDQMQAASEKSIVAESERAGKAEARVKELEAQLAASAAQPNQ